jgi:hypothetical protein
MSTPSETSYSEVPEVSEDSGHGENPEWQTGAIATAPAGPFEMMVGWLLPGSDTAALLVDFPTNPSGPIRARTTVALDEASLKRAVAMRQGVVLMFECRNAALPIVVGLLAQAPSELSSLLNRQNLDSPSSPGQEDKLRLDVSAPSNGPSAGSESMASASVEVLVDGKKVTVRGQDEVTLQCGEASLTLCRDGKILLRGTYIETYADGVNRIKGAQVKIN